MAVVPGVKASIGKTTVSATDRFAENGFSSYPLVALTIASALADASVFSSEFLKDLQTESPPGTVLVVLSD